MSVPYGTENNREDVAGVPAVPSVRYWLASLATGAVALAPLAVVGAPVHAHLSQAGLALVICGIVAAVEARAGAGRVVVAVGIALCALSAWLLSQASYAGASWTVAPILGLGVGMIMPERRGRAVFGAVIPAIGFGALLVLLRFTAGRDATMAAGAMGVAVAGVAAFPLAPPSRRLRDAGTFGLAALAAAAAASYIGATTPTATWFGKLIFQGPGNTGEVAITFDDGPNPPYTLRIRDILDQRGVKATFFTVGKALDKRPDVSKALMADGMLIACHSYHHDAVSWMDPRYRELRSTSDAFMRNLGVLPTFYRPPHGTHTPFMARAMADKGMKMVTWSVSAADWATTDGELVARRILAKVRPGSIILLHDGIDGNIGADRSVVLEALPLILDGLEARGLRPVTLDKLLRVPGYVGTA
jgi:peptidoglycan/xylan/chitin deacetylase (PgdA/CDA1 family)